MQYCKAIFIQLKKNRIGIIRVKRTERSPLGRQGIDTQPG